MTWSRRQLLQLLGAGAATHALTPLLTSCGGAQTHTAGLGRRPERPLAEINDTVRAAVARLSQQFRSATGYVVRSARGHAVVDETEKRVDSNTYTSLVFRAVNDTGTFERATTDLSDAGINIAELQLRQRTTQPVVTALPPHLSVATEQFATRTQIDPRDKTAQDWLAQLEQLFNRARNVGDSRIVYRGAHLLIDDSESVFVTPDSEITQRLVRSHAGVSFVAWTGNRPNADSAVRAGTMGLEALQISTAELDAAARRALSLLTARRGQDFDGQVLLAPDVVALLARECLGPALAGDRWASKEIFGGHKVGKRLGSKLINVTDDPTLAGLFGSYFVDDEGKKAQRTQLINSGMLVGAITDLTSAAALKLPHTSNGRRPTQVDRARAHFSNLAFGPGAQTKDQLIASVDKGVLIDGGVRAQFDPHTWRLVVRAARTLEIRKGRLTGRLFADGDLVSDLPSLLGAVTGMSNTVQYRASTTGIPTDISTGIPTTTGGPYMLTRAKLVGHT